jgi:hypothetical protein
MYDRITVKWAAATSWSRRKVGLEGLGDAGDDAD